MRPMIAWKPDSRATSIRRPSSCLADAAAAEVAVDVDRVLDGGAVGGRSLYGDSDAKPTTWRVCVVDRDDRGEGAAARVIHRCWSSTVRGTRSNVAVVCSTSRL
jgi:hypothetical protein